MEIAENATRVTRNTPHAANRRIEEQTRFALAYHRAHPEQIGERLQRLDREWDIERVLMANAATLGLVGLGLGIFVNRKFLALPVVVNAFLLQHALQGWCPPLPLIRWLGVRTQQEIEEERHALLDMQPSAGMSPVFSG